MASVSFFAASLARNQDYASRLVYDLYIHEQMQVTHDPETGMFRTYEDVVRNVLAVIGTGGWMTVNLLHHKEREPDDYEAMLRVLILCKTPMPDTLASDIARLARHEDAPDDDIDPALRGQLARMDIFRPLPQFERKRGTLGHQHL